MNGYWELCRCGHTYYRHAWVPDPATFDPNGPQKTDCTSCCCTAFEGTGHFDLSESPLYGDAALAKARERYNVLRGLQSEYDKRPPFIQREDGSNG